MEHPKLQESGNIDYGKEEIAGDEKSPDGDFGEIAGDEEDPNFNVARLELNLCAVVFIC